MKDSETPNLNELRSIVTRLFNLCADPHPGLFSWNTCLADALMQLSPFALRPKGFPKIITLCGSTRFMDEYVSVQREETLKGHIVISIGLFGHQEGLDMSGDAKKKLDELHLRKIDLADEVFVINSVGGKCDVCGRFCFSSYCPDCSRSVIVVPYIGESTKREIEYATKIGKPVRYMNKPTRP